MHYSRSWSTRLDHHRVQQRQRDMSIGNTLYGAESWRNRMMGKSSHLGVDDSYSEGTE